MATSPTRASCRPDKGAEPGQGAGGSPKWNDRAATLYLIMELLQDHVPVEEQLKVLNLRHLVMQMKLLRLHCLMTLAQQ